MTFNPSNRWAFLLFFDYRRPDYGFPTATTISATAGAVEETTGKLLSQSDILFFIRKLPTTVSALSRQCFRNPSCPLNLMTFLRQFQNRKSGNYRSNRSSIGTAAHFLMDDAERTGDHRLSTSCRIVVRPDHQCGDDLVLIRHFLRVTQCTLVLVLGNVYGIRYNLASVVLEMDFLS